MIDDLIQKLQDDVTAVLTNDEQFTFIPVYTSRTPLKRGIEGQPVLGQSMMIEEQIEQALGGMSFKNGKCGIVAIVLEPDVEPVSENSVGPAVEMITTVRLIEDRLFNEGADGTGITVGRLGLHVTQLLHRRSFDSMGTLFPDGANMVKDITLPDDRRAREIRMRLTTSLPALVKVTRPLAVRDTNVITLTCATADAVLYYTLTGTFPGPQNPDSIVYEAPVSVEAGQELRCCAYAPGLQCSDDVWI